MTTSSSDEWKCSDQNTTIVCWSGHQDSWARQRLPHPQNGVEKPELQLPVQQIPGHDSVFGCRLEQVRGQRAERLIGGDPKPASGNRGVPRLALPLPSDLDAAVTLKQRVHGQTVDRELLNRCPERTRDPLHDHSLPPKQLNDISQPRGQEVSARKGFLSSRSEAIEHGHSNSAVNAG